MQANRPWGLPASTAIGSAGERATFVAVRPNPCEPTATSRHLFPHMKIHGSPTVLAAGVAMLFAGYGCNGPSPVAQDTGDATTVAAETTTAASTDTGSEGPDGTATEAVPGCDPPCEPGLSCEVEDGDPVCTCAPQPDACPTGTTCDDDGRCSGLTWPNADSWANSDPWIVEHHQQITQMRPRVLAINYVNARSMEQMDAQLTEMREILAESSRWHGHSDPDAPPFLDYDLAYQVDLRDAQAPPGWPYNNSTAYPREEPQQGSWGFDYERLFDADYADLLGIEDPTQPGDNLRLCDAIELGLVHEVWIYGDADVPDVSAAEMLELKPHYDEDGNRLPGAMNRCAGNGCFDDEDVIPCGRSVRVAWFNNTRGPGCFLESVSHAFEGMGRKGGQVLPYLSRYFPELAGMQLDDEHGLPFENWYACPYGEDCLSYPEPDTVSYAVSETQTGTLRGYDPVCGNVHWAPNARRHYDLSGTDAVRSSCVHWRDGSGQTEIYDGSQHAPLTGYAPDCMGPFLVWWRQNLPGRDNTALDDDGAAMLNFWPFLFY